MKISIQNLTKLIREAVEEELGSKSHAAFGPDKRLDPKTLTQALEKLKAKKRDREREKEERATSPSVQQRRAAAKQSVRGMNVESGFGFPEEERPDGIPQEVIQHAKEVAEKYLEGYAHWMSLEDVFYDMSEWTADPMEAVTALYNELNIAAQDGIAAGFGPVPDSYKRKIQKAYRLLTDLARQERKMKNYGL